MSSCLLNNRLDNRIAGSSSSLVLSQCQYHPLFPECNSPLLNSSLRHTGQQWKWRWWTYRRRRALSFSIKSSPPTPARENIETLRVRAAASSPQNISANTTVNRTYRRIADCIIFPPLQRRKPRALIHFIGGAFIGAVPEVTYSFFIDLLRQQDYLIIATPYNVTFEHTIAAKLVHNKFMHAKDALINGDLHVPGVNADDIGNLPVFSIGHSNGALLQMLIGCIFQENLPKASAVISFNNKPASDAVPYFEQLGPVTAQLTPLIASSPLLDASKGLSDSFRNLLDAALPILPQYDQESLQSLQNFVEQLPLVLDQVSKGVSEFTPAPSENRRCIETDYKIKNTLLVKYKIDAIDESDIIEDILEPAMQRVGGSLTKIVLDGNHITPCVQDIRWETGRVYTPFDAVRQLLRSLALSEVRETVTSISNWFNQFL
ncbi:hypothetical protein KP509_26G009300 [Ceratopteris richardii]|uniref:Uncharacterized protein n=1 Tax=Ceratopteris richardii TaxID=49495 RepID=A0A8T2RHX9_CERRI|nr:hypothetical protein KP509_26G009300 [Ceratopteris richardii]